VIALDTTVLLYAVTADEGFAGVRGLTAISLAEAPIVLEL